MMTATEKMVTIEFYLLGDDQTWDTDFISFPQSLYVRYLKDHNPSPILDWVYANVKFKDGICMVGIYNDESVDVGED
jgi:hypothetical protein